MIPNAPGKAIPATTEEPRVHVFTYGSLMYPLVWERVVAGRYRALPGTVRGFARRRIAGEVYPAMLRASPASAVEGVLYLDLSAGDVAALDHFEGSAYERIEVMVETADGDSYPAWSYLYVDSSRVEEAPWEPGRFAGEDLAYFIDSYCRERGIA